MMRLTILLSIILSCFSKTKIDTTALQREWMLVSFQNYSKEKLIQKKASFRITNDSSISIFMGCNQMGATYHIEKENQISLSSGISTMMACEDMQLEIDFGQILPQIISYKIEGHRLTLTTAKDEKLEFVAADWD